MVNKTHADQQRLTTWKRSYVAFAMGAACTAMPALAQQTPGAGDLLRQQPKPVTQPNVPPQQQPETPVVQPDDAAGQRVLVKGFKIEGASLIPEAELQAKLQAATNKELTFLQLEGVRLFLVGRYIERGYLARVILPPQEIKDGIVRFEIVEGQRGDLTIDNQSTRIDTARLQAMVDARIPRGAAFDFRSVAEAINVLNDQPGVNARMTLGTGQTEREVGIVMTVQDGPRYQASAGINNGGTSGTGEYQANASVAVNNVTGHLDMASLTANVSDGVRYLRADYGIGLGNRGLRIGASAAHLRYDITEGAFTALDPHGTATTLGLSASYPVARLADHTVMLVANFDHKKLVDRITLGETSHRRVDVATVGITGNTAGALLGNARMAYNVGLSMGESKEDNDGAAAIDAVSRRASGQFVKFMYGASYARALSAQWSILGSLRGQRVGQNLDSSERMSLGGPGGVRAFPVGEATGDEATIGSLGMAWQVGSGMSVSAFIDGGHVRVNKETWAGWNTGTPTLPNSYELLGLGVEAVWQIGPRAAVTATIAAPMGNNPGRDGADQNVDGSAQNSTRGWLSATFQF